MVISKLIHIKRVKFVVCFIRLDAHCVDVLLARIYRDELSCAINGIDVDDGNVLGIACMNHPHPCIDVWAKGTSSGWQLSS